MPVQLLVLNLYPVYNQLVVHGILEMESMPHWVPQRDLSLVLLVTNTVQDVPRFHIRNTLNVDSVAHPNHQWRTQAEVGMLLPYSLVLS